MQNAVGEPTFFFSAPLCADWLLALQQTEVKSKGLVSPNRFAIVPQTQKYKDVQGGRAIHASP